MNRENFHVAKINENGLNISLTPGSVPSIMKDNTLRAIIAKHDMPTIHKEEKQEEKVQPEEEKRDPSRRTRYTVFSCSLDMMAAAFVDRLCVSKLGEGSGNASVFVAPTGMSFRTFDEAIAATKEWLLEAW